ncbi:MAG: HU family DNA-binding protein [Tannerellaceae bacterium]|nr:HU family DNA-binding protein [Tannerellaceae bacterium]
MTLRYQVHQVKNARFPEEKPAYSVSLVSYQNINRAHLAKQLCHSSSFTPGDLTGIIDNLVMLIAEHLSSGYTVTLDGLGTFSVSAELKEPVTDPENISGHNLRVKRICFKPAPEFKRLIETGATFERYVPIIKHISPEE